MCELLLLLSSCLSFSLQCTFSFLLPYYQCLLFLAGPMPSLARALLEPFWALMTPFQALPSPAEPCQSLVKPCWPNAEHCWSLAKQHQPNAKPCQAFKALLHLGEPCWSWSLAEPCQPNANPCWVLIRSLLACISHWSTYLFLCDVWWCNKSTTFYVVSPVCYPPMPAFENFI